jgi:outer membrane protein insertion porin family/translocation and assembly module TamA
MRNLVLGLVACTSLLGLGCREDEEGSLRVADIEFRGVEAFTPSQLKAAIATTKSSRLPWGRKRYFDRGAFEADLDRLRQFYRDNGYPDARVVSFDAKIEDDKSIALVITLDEGAPIVVEDVKLQGFEGIPATHFDRLKSTLPLAPGEVQKRSAIIATRDLALRELQDHGFAHATVDMADELGVGAGRVVWTVTATPGPKAHFGPVEITGNVSVAEDVIRRELAFQPGTLFNLGDLQESQRRLYALELFQYANIEPRLAGAAAEVPVRLTVAEGKPRQLRGAVGYGSEERARAEIGWQHRNFFGGARTAGVNAKWSSLDRGVRLDFSQPYFLGRQTLAASGQRWYADEPAFLLDTTGMRLAITRERNRRDPAVNRGSRTTVSGSLIYELESYRIRNFALLDLKLRDDLIALGLDPRTASGEGTLAALALDVRRDTTTNLLDARQGYVLSAHVEQAGTFMPGDFDYTEITGEGRHYLQIGPQVVWANKVRLGSIAGRGAGEQVPFFKRYFLGGSNSLRGWGRYEVAPLSASGLPIGGFSFLEIISEARFPLFGRFGAVAFLDVGNAWAGSRDFDLGDLRAAVGPGLRYGTPIGPIRFDIGYQLTPIANLLVDGAPQPRRWRMHFSIGHAF